MSRFSFVRLLSVLALALFALTLGAHKLLAATITYEVGTCKPGHPTFSTITAALTAVPSPNVVLVCPGSYYEQIEITFPVILEGVVAANAGQAVVYPPPNGFVGNATDDYGELFAAQLFVNNVAGTVNVSDLTFDAQDQAAPSAQTVGIFYQNSFGTVNEVVTRYQSPASAPGRGIVIEGGPANPTVTVENSSVAEYADLGIQAESNTAASQLTATIKGNYVNGGGGANVGIQIQQGITATVSDNLVLNNGDYGIPIYGPIGGSVSNNTLVNNWIGVVSLSDAVSVTSNKIFESFWAVELGSSDTVQGIATIQGNTIGRAGSVGIEFGCLADPNVRSNTFSLMGTALDKVPTAIVTTNSYFNVATIRTGGC
jgi:parallel beta-helix repeat protein